MFIFFYYVKKTYLVWHDPHTTIKYAEASSEGVSGMEEQKKERGGIGGMSHKVL